MCTNSKVKQGLNPIWGFRNSNCEVPTNIMREIVGIVRYTMTRAKKISI